MGVLKFKNDVEELLVKDPYELFTLEEPHQIARRMRPEFWGAACLGVLIAFGVAVTAFLNVQRDGQPGGDTPFAYFEIKAIDPEGHPVAGAVVKDGDKALGVTDSFGEWRRFMRVKLGSTVALTIGKKTEGGPLVAVKNMAVPARLPQSGDLELTGSVQLARGGSVKGVPERVPGKRAADAATSEAPAVAAAQARALAPAAPATKLPSSIWFMAEAPNGTPRAELMEVVGALRRRALELGMRIDPEAAWRVRVGDILVARKTADRPERRLVVVDGRAMDDGKESRLFTYLREYQETPLRTARDILWAATVHVALPHRVTPQADGTFALERSTPVLWELGAGRIVHDASGQAHAVADGANGLVLTSAPADCEAGCAVTTPGSARQSPVPGWERLRFRLPVASRTADVYVSGYEARRVDDQTFEYWGNPATGGNITVVDGGRLVYRGRAPAQATIAAPERLPKATRL